MLLLRLGAAGSFCVSLLHVVIVFVGAPAYRFFGAGEHMARLDEQGSLQPALLTLFLAAVFCVWGLYALSAAGSFRALPFTKWLTAVIGGIYTLRGLLIVVQLWFYWGNSNGLVHLHDIGFSLASLAIGLLYLGGLAQRWRQLA
jgi:hypothetical protein